MISNHFNNFSKNITVLACVDEAGLICHQSKNGYVDRHDLLDFMRTLKKKMRHRKIAVFLDNLSVHRCREIREKAEEYGW